MRARANGEGELVIIPTKWKKGHCLEFEGASEWFQEKDMVLFLGETSHPEALNRNK